MKGEMPTILTQRLQIHRVTCNRIQEGFLSRDVYLAWLIDDDIPRPIATIVISPHYDNYVEWVHVEPEWRRQGIATEALAAIEQRIGELCLTGVTPEGEHLERSWYESASIREDE